MDALLWLVILSLGGGAVYKAFVADSRAADPDEDDDDEDGIDIYTPTATDDSGVWLRNRMGWRVEDRFPCGQNWKRPA
jgi:hypothetical protein